MFRIVFVRCESSIESVHDTDIVTKTLFLLVATAYFRRRPKRPYIADKTV